MIRRFTSAQFVPANAGAKAKNPVGSTLFSTPMVALLRDPGHKMLRKARRGLPALPARSSPASQQSGDGGLPGEKIALDLQLADLAVQIVDHLLRIRGRRRRAAARKQLSRTLHQLLFPVADHRRMNPNSADSSARVFSPDSDAIATRALNSALCCFLFMPTSHAPLDRSALAYPAVQKSGAAAPLELPDRRARLKLT